MTFGNETPSIDTGGGLENVDGPGIDDVEAGTAEAEREVRIDSEEGDDLPVTPPEMQPRTGASLASDDFPAPESIEQRIMQEEPDPDSAYGAPDDEGGLEAEARSGGDDPDAIPADQDFVGGGENTNLVFDGPAEEAAMRLTEPEV
ncbi:MAG: adenosine deaminase [Dermatophilus congolensis]|nr:adenosine deaminase [Dermatophilus congolensis]